MPDSGAASGAGPGANPGADAGASAGPGLLSAEFQEQVRDALLHLHDVTYHQTHPLARLVDAPPGQVSALRGKLVLQGLLDAIRSLRPVAGTPADSRAWRVCRLLELRYVEGLTAADVMAQLALGKTQYHRDHARALAAVASSLWDRWRLGERRSPETAAREPPAEPRPETPPASLAELARSEADQMASQMTREPVDLAETLAGLVALLRPVAAESGTALALRAGPDLPPVQADRVVLRQVLLGLLNAALDHAAGGAVDLSLGLAGGAVELELAVAPGEADAAPPEPADLLGPDAGAAAPAVLAVARRLVEMLDGTLDVPSAPPAAPGIPPWAARLALPVAHRPLVLVLDNHPDFINLVARYLAEHDWQVVGAGDVAQAQALALERRPSVILLDVMMPGQDGWDLLLALKSRPETRAIPVVVCSILYEPRVARALGAAGYLPKPISQRALLEALAPHRRRRPEPATAP